MSTTNHPPTTDGSIPLPTDPQALFDHVALDDPTEPRQHPLPGHTSDLSWDDVTPPESVPTTETAAAVALAERLLERVRSHEGFGHHVDIADSIIDFANDHRDDDATPDYWRRRAYQLGPRQINTHSIHAEEDRDDPDVPDDGVTPSMVEKAQTIISWACAEFDNKFLRDVRQSLTTEHAERWTDAAAAARRRRDGAKLLAALPETVNGWQLVPTPANAIAYAGPATTSSGDERATDPDAPDHAIAVLFESDDYIRLFTVPADNYDHINPARVNRIEYDDLVTYRRWRLANPDSWPDGAATLLEHLTGVAPSDEATPCPEAATSSLASIHAQQPTDAITAATDAFDDITADPPTPSDDIQRDKQQAGIADF